MAFEYVNLVPGQVSVNGEVNDADLGDGVDATGIVCHSFSESKKVDKVYYQSKRGTEWRLLPKPPQPDSVMVYHMKRVFLLSRDNQVHVFDLATLGREEPAAWRSVSSMPGLMGEEYVWFAGFNGKIFVVPESWGSSKVYDIATDTWELLTTRGLQVQERYNFFLFNGRPLMVSEMDDDPDDLLDVSGEFWASVNLGTWLKEDVGQFDVSTRFCFDIELWAIEEYDFVTDEVTRRFTCAGVCTSLMEILADLVCEVGGFSVRGSKALVEIYYSPIKSIVFEGTLDMEKRIVSWEEVPLPPNSLNVALTA
ncbi:hypothetical protein SELMODRAFT_420650 [Selaginella moellendorffii]|uniref:Uncharacterized protein n=1 Tax=Selaginella moellendorffii TaxID=88036 RepID=D8SCP0_SELML|nr:hypothetical protein SELMODRAFT_420650 [Selaginella moellendorffii]